MAALSRRSPERVFVARHSGEVVIVDRDPAPGSCFWSGRLVAVCRGLVEGLVVQRKWIL